MDYQKHYLLLINKARTRLHVSGYIERHHVVPRCLGGGDNSENLVKLTGREHFIAHLLLVKIYPKHKGLIFAVHRMLYSKKGFVKNNRCYEWVRIQSNHITSEIHRNKIVTEETKQKLRATRHILVQDSDIRHRQGNGRRNNPSWNANLTGLAYPQETKERIKVEQSKKIKEEKTYILSIEQREKISQALKGRAKPPRSEEHLRKLRLASKGRSCDPKRRKVQCIETGEIFESLCAAGRSVNGNGTNIAACANGKYYSSYGFTWRFIDA